MASDGNSEGDRTSEWFVPRFGPIKFRVLIGLLFLPYTGMVISFAIIGSMLADTVHWDRLLAIVVIYLLGLGVGAHTLDATGGGGVKPWGKVFSQRQLWILAGASLTSAYMIAVYYMVVFVPWLWPIAILEGFFVFAYNLEWFGGRFHTDYWFAFSWGFLPVLAGYVMQTNALSPAAALMAASMAFFSLIEIKASRPYKDLKKRWPALQEEEKGMVERYETILKCVSLGVIFLGIGLLIWRIMK
jgi:hypothetical protein